MANVAAPFRQLVTASRRRWLSTVLVVVARTWSARQLHQLLCCRHHRYRCPPRSRVHEASVWNDSQDPVNGKRATRPELDQGSPWVGSALGFGSVIGPN